MKISAPVREFSLVSTKGQTVIPKSIRKELGIKEGTKLAWILRDGNLTVFPIPDDPVAASVGMLEGHGTFDEWLAERNAERERERQQEEEDEQWRGTSSTPRP
jgi:AbrB family looped-hinge helix DNA binding protein